MKKRPLWIFVLAVSMTPVLIFGQVGIETDFPRNPLTVKGLIQSTQDGYQYPDGSMQQKAVQMSAPGNAAETRHIIVMEAQGINGSYQGMNYQDAMRVFDLKWGVYYNLVPDSLLTTGQRIHKVLTVTKDIDKGSVQLIQKMIDASVISEVTIDFYISGGGNPILYYKITMQDVRVVKLDQEVEFKEDATGYAHMERVSFSFTQLEWDWTDGHINYVDDLMSGPPVW
jgi:type VI secretion system Hcp family effector